MLVGWRMAGLGFTLMQEHRETFACFTGCIDLYRYSLAGDKHAYICVCMYICYILRRLHTVSPKFLIRISTKAGVLCMGVSKYYDIEQFVCTGSLCSMPGLICVYMYMAIYIYIR